MKAEAESKDDTSRKFYILEDRLQCALDFSVLIPPIKIASSTRRALLRARTP